MSNPPKLIIYIQPWETFFRGKVTPRAIRYREREHLDALLEQAMHAESQTSFFLSGAGTNIGILFVLIVIVMSLWVFSSALPG